MLTTYIKTRRLGKASDATCETAPAAISMLTDATRELRHTGRYVQLLKELRQFREQYKRLECTATLPPVPPLPPAPPPPPRPSPRPSPPPDLGAGCRALLQDLDDTHSLADETDVQLWLQENCSAHMLVGRGAVTTVLVGDDSSDRDEPEEGVEAR